MFRMPKGVFVHQYRSKHTDKNYYEILKVEKTASGDVIREAFLDQSKKVPKPTRMSV